eukprot:6950_1
MDHLEISTNKETDKLLESTATEQSCNLSTFQWIILVIVGVLLSALATNMDRIISSQKSDKNDSSPSYDIIIVGGGSTGLLNGNLLKDAYPNKKILILEQLNRIGGRQFSTKVTSRINNDSITFDHAAWRFTTTPYLMKLMQYLNICDSAYPYSSLFRSNTSIALTEIRNDRTINKNVNISYYSKIFRLQPNDIALWKQYDTTASKTLLQFLAEYILHENNQSQYPAADQVESWVTMRNNWTFKGFPLNQWGISAAIKALNVFSDEFIAVSAQLGAIATRNTQLGVHISSLFAPRYGQGVIYLFKNGFQGLSNALYERFGTDNVKLQQRVMGIDKKGDGYVIRTNQDKYECTHVILSIPVANLRRLVPNIAPLSINKKLLNIVNSMEDLIVTKMSFIYSSNDFEPEELRILNQISGSYHREAFQNIWFSQNESLCYLLIFSDTQVAEFWWNLQQATNTEEYNISENVSVGNLNETTIASTAVVDFVTLKMNEFLSVYNISMAMPLAAFVSVWGKDIEEMGASTNGPIGGFNFDEAIDYSLKPDENENIFISVSDFSKGTLGGIEGGIGNVIQNVMKNFNIQIDPLQSYEGCFS